jgi:hypothetical protein
MIFMVAVIAISPVTLRWPLHPKWKRTQFVAINRQIDGIFPVAAERQALQIQHQIYRPMSGISVQLKPELAVQWWNDHVAFFIHNVQC